MYSRNAYIRLLDDITNYGYTFANTKNFNPESSEKQILIRHDVDISPVFALELAELESRFGANSIYLILLNSPLYNPFCEFHKDNIKKIHDLGHTIGVHVDLSGDKKPSSQVIAAIKLAKRIFPFVESAFSWHQPHALIKSSVNLEISGIDNLYSDKFIKGNVVYKSDSCMMRNQPWDFSKAVKHMGYSKLHFLFHPIYWVEEKIPENLSAFMLSRMINEYAGHAISIKCPWTESLKNLKAKPFDQIEKTISHLLEEGAKNG